VIDLHTHLLPAVDDGARTREIALGVLAGFADEGVTRLVCTPHLRASESMSAPRLRMESLARELAESATHAPQLEVGWEIMLDTTGMDLTRPTLRLGDSQAVLVEFPRTGVPPRAVVELSRLARSGIIPVLAHPERYWGIALAHVREWRAAGVLMQVDASSIGAEGNRGRITRSLFAEGLVDMIASDNHGDQRSMADGVRRLQEIGAGELATLLTTINPGRLLADEPLEPVPPLRDESGWVDRLRHLFLGGR
jgi:protein-tyrosine phosphatase